MRSARRVARWTGACLAVALLLVGSEPSSLRAEIDAPSAGQLAAAKLVGARYLNQDPHYSTWSPEVGPFGVPGQTAS